MGLLGVEKFPRWHVRALCPVIFASMPEHIAFFVADVSAEAVGEIAEVDGDSASCVSSASDALLLSEPIYCL